MSLEEAVTLVKYAFTNATQGELFIKKAPACNIQTPVFMPVGTIGAVKTFSPHELEGLGSDIILGNT